MKKGIAISLVALTLLLATGCGKEKLTTCEANNTKLTSKIVYTAKGDSIYKQEEESVLNLKANNLTKASAEANISATKAKWSKVEKATTFEYEVTDETATIEATIDFKNKDTKMQDFVDAGLVQVPAGKVPLYLSLKATVTGLESSGYTCK